MSNQSVTAKKPLKKEAKKSASKRGAVETSGFVQIQRPINLHLNLNLRCARDVRSSLERALAGLSRDGEPLIASAVPSNPAAAGDSETASLDSKTHPSIWRQLALSGRFICGPLADVDDGEDVGALRCGRWSAAKNASVSAIHPTKTNRRARSYARAPSARRVGFKTASSPRTRVVGQRSARAI